MLLTQIIIVIAIFTQCSQSQNCNTGNFFNGQRCAPCKPNCQCKAEQTCDSCISGYTFDQTFKECLQCPISISSINVGCAQCCYQVQGTSFLCSECPDLTDTFLQGGQCLRLIGCQDLSQTGRCSSCKIGYYLSNGICEPCHASCSKCIDPDFCLSCASGYFENDAINTGFCESCSTGCQQCTSTTACSKCKQKYYLDGSICQACSSSLCITCSSSGCQTCEKGSGLVSSLCVSCSNTANGGHDGCEQCSSSETSLTCTKCSNGYYLTGGTCKTCHSLFPNSILCTSSEVIQCLNDYVTQVDKRYYKIQNKCILNIYHCKTMKSTDGLCSDCYFETDNYYKFEDNKCVKCQQTGCASFSQTTCQCTGCLNEYQFVNTQCIKCQNPHCYKCQSSITLCQSCKPYYGLISSACLGCTQNTCLNCDGNTALCNQCIDEYYLHDGTCYKCQDNCKICLSSTQCLQCHLGKYLLSNGRCKRLPSNCVEVKQNGECQKCEYGYYLRLGYCFPCTAQMFNLQSCQKFCPSYYEKTQKFERNSLIQLSLFLGLYLFLLG